MRLATHLEYAGFVTIEKYMEIEDVIRRNRFPTFRIDDFFNRQISHETVGSHAIRLHRQDREQRRTAGSAVDVGQDLLIALADDSQFRQVIHIAADRTAGVQLEEMIRIELW